MEAELYVLPWNYLQDTLFSENNKEQNSVYSLLSSKLKRGEENTHKHTWMYEHISRKIYKTLGPKKLSLERGTGKQW